MLKSKRNNLTTIEAYEPEAVVALTRDGEFIAEFGSCAQADGILGFAPGASAGIISGRGISAGPKRTLIIAKSKYNPEIRVTHASLKRKRDFLKARR